MYTIDNNLIGALKNIQAGMALRAECNDKVTITKGLMATRLSCSKVPDQLVNEGRSGAARALAEAYLHLIAVTEAFEAAHECPGQVMAQLAVVAKEYSNSTTLGRD